MRTTRCSPPCSEPDLSEQSVGSLDLRLAIDIEDGFGVTVSYRLAGQATFTDIPLNAARASRCPRACCARC